MNVSLVTIWSKHKYKYIIEHNANFFSDVTIFINYNVKLENLNFKHSNINFIFLPAFFHDVKSFSDIRNYCLRYFAINKNYLFLDDDEWIKTIDFTSLIDVDFGRIWINNFPSVVRYFRYSDKLFYQNDVHEELNINTERILNIKIEHFGKYTESKILWYLELTNNIYYKLRDSKFINIEYILNKQQIKKIFDNNYNNISIWILLLVHKKFFNWNHGLVEDEFLLIDSYLKKVIFNNNHDNNFINNLIENNVEIEDIMHQNIYQDKFDLLLNFGEKNEK